MSDVIELRNHGLACLGLAKAATTSSDQQVMLFMANAWLKLAEQRREFHLKVGDAFVVDAISETTLASVEAEAGEELDRLAEQMTGMVRKASASKR